MDLHETNHVKRSDERPARQDGTCFYCREPMGGQHKPECVIVAKSVVLQMTIDVIVDVPRHWDASTIEFKYEGSSWCADNLLRELGEWADRDDRDGESELVCSCSVARFTLLRDATEDDHARLPVLIDKNE